MDQLLHAFGIYLFGALAEKYPEVLQGMNSAGEIMASVDRIIQVEVRKLIPDAETPTFVVEVLAEDEFEVTYQSPRGLTALAQGLIEGTANRFQQTAVFGPVAALPESNTWRWRVCLRPLVEEPSSARTQG